MALLNQEARDDLPEDVVEEVDQAEANAGQEGGDTEQIRISRRQQKREQEAERVRAAEEAAAARAAESAELRQRLDRQSQETAHLRGTLEQINARLAQSSQPTPAARQDDDAGAIRDKIQRQVKKAETALTGGDISEYHARMERVMELKAREIVAAQPKPPAQVVQAQPAQKPDWVRAIEYQYPEVLTHPNGQRMAGALEAVIEGNFGPEKLHRMFQEARTRLGIKAPAAPAAAGARALLTGIESNGTGPRPKPGQRVVTIPKDALNTMLRAGLTRAQAAKAYADSYPDESV